MKLEKYLKLMGQSQTKFAKRICVSQPAINRYITGKRYPSREMVHRIEVETDGAVTVLDWYNQEKAE